MIYSYEVNMINFLKDFFFAMSLEALLTIVQLSTNYNSDKIIGSFLKNTTFLNCSIDIKISLSFIQ